MVEIENVEIQGVIGPCEFLVEANLMLDDDKKIRIRFETSDDSGVSELAAKTSQGWEVMEIAKPKDMLPLLQLGALIWNKMFEMGIIQNEGV